jgi:hypothetical protein
MRRAVVAALAGFLALASAGAASTAFRPRDASWLDARHAWAPNNFDRWACIDDHLPRGVSGSRVCATEDGGQTWRSIFHGGNYVFGVARTSLTTGIVSTGGYTHSEWWTVDRGGHWYSTGVVYDGPEPIGSAKGKPIFRGRGHTLFWMRSLGDTIWRIAPWPPVPPPSCNGTWSWSLDLEYDASPDGNICVAPPIDGELRSTQAFVLPGRRLWELTPLKDGSFAALFLGRGLEPVVWHAGVFRHARMRLPGGVTKIELTEQWPRVKIKLLRASGWIVWRSRDGGRTWHQR